jgi:hypothetical protein
VHGRADHVRRDGENVDATLGTILMRRPASEEHPRWERLLSSPNDVVQPARGLFFLAANADLPMAFVQALLAIGYRVIPLRGAARRSSIWPSADPRGDRPPIGRRPLGQQRRGFHPAGERPVLDAAGRDLGFTEFRNQGSPR